MGLKGESSSCQLDCGAKIEMAMLQDTRVVFHTACELKTEALVSLQ